MAVATAAKALPTMTSRREAPAVQRGLVVVIQNLALTVALVRENPRTDERLIESNGPPAQLCGAKSRYSCCRVMGETSRRRGFEARPPDGGHYPRQSALELEKRS